ncbi:MAG: hypothetical protein KAR11_03275 [Phycisphaerae bacterium]|nr:hypothetical protein [Phycisphaerae bacterium]
MLILSSALPMVGNGRPYETRSWPSLRADHACPLQIIDAVGNLIRENLVERRGHLGALV